MSSGKSKHTRYYYNISVSKMITMDTLEMAKTKAIIGCIKDNDTSGIHYLNKYSTVGNQQFSGFRIGANNYLDKLPDVSMTINGTDQEAVKAVIEKEIGKTISIIRTIETIPYDIDWCKYQLSKISTYSIGKDLYTHDDMYYKYYTEERNGNTFTIALTPIGDVTVTTYLCTDTSAEAIADKPTKENKVVTKYNKIVHISDNNGAELKVIIDEISKTKTEVDAGTTSPSNIYEVISTDSYTVTGDNVYFTAPAYDRATYIFAEYTIDSQGDAYYWYYNPFTGVYPQLNNRYANVTMPKLFPIVLLRHNFFNLNEYNGAYYKNIQGDGYYRPSSITRQRYTETEYLLRKLNVNISDVTKSINDNSDNDKFEDAFYLLGFCPSNQNQNLSPYLFNFFETIYEKTLVEDYSSTTLNINEQPYNATMSWRTLPARIIEGRAPIASDRNYGHTTQVKTYIHKFYAVFNYHLTSNYWYTSWGGFFQLGYRYRRGNLLYIIREIYDNGELISVGKVTEFMPYLDGSDGWHYVTDGYNGDESYGHWEDMNEEVYRTYLQSTITVNQPIHISYKYNYDNDGNLTSVDTLVEYGSRGDSEDYNFIYQALELLMYKQLDSNSYKKLTVSDIVYSSFIERQTVTLGKSSSYSAHADASLRGYDYYFRDSDKEEIQTNIHDWDNIVIPLSSDIALNKLTVIEQAGLLGECCYMTVYSMKKHVYYTSNSGFWGGFVKIFAVVVMIVVTVVSFGSAAPATVTGFAAFMAMVEAALPMLLIGVVATFALFIIDQFVDDPTLKMILSSVVIVAAAYASFYVSGAFTVWNAISTGIDLINTSASIMLKAEMKQIESEMNKATKDFEKKIEALESKSKEVEDKMKSFDSFISASDLASMNKRGSSSPEPLYGPNLMYYGAINMYKSFDILYSAPNRISTFVDTTLGEYKIIDI